jgi:hypothetical protein
MQRLMIAAALSRALTDWMTHASQRRPQIRTSDWTRRESALDQPRRDRLQNGASSGY